MTLYTNLDPTVYLYVNRCTVPNRLGFVIVGKDVDLQALARETKSLAEWETLDK
jgi:hypothetical protein